MNNPIIQRELVGMLRTRKALALMVCLAAILAVLVVLRWPSDSRADVSGAGAQQVFRIFGYGLMTMLILLVPVFPATTVVREKVGGTLALLLNSPMSPWAIYLGKLVGVLGFVLILLMVSLPAAAACYAMGGIGLFSQFLALYLILAIVAIQYATLGLLVSTYAASTDSALRFTYGLILLLSVVTMGPYQFFQGTGLPIIAPVADWLRCFSPIPAVMEVMRHEGVGTLGIWSGGNKTFSYTVLALLSTAGFVVWTARRLNQTMFDRARPQGTITDERSAKEQRRRRVYYLWFFDPQRRSELIGTRWGFVLLMLVLCAVMAAISVGLWYYFYQQPTPAAHAVVKPVKGAPPAFTISGWTMAELAQLLSVIFSACLSFLFLGMAAAHLAVTNPVAAKEFRCRRFGRSHWIVRMVAGCGLLSLALTYFSTLQTMTWGVREVGGIMVLLQVALIVLLTPSLASGLISSERESGGWTLLQMTPLSSLTIVIGKVVSVIATLVLILFATLPGYVVMIYIEPAMWQQVWQVMVCLLFTAVFALLTSAAVSSLCKRTAQATVVSYTILVLVCAGTMLFWLGRDAPFSHATVETVLRVNPMAAALTIIEIEQFKRYNLVPANWWVMGALIAVALLALSVRTYRLTRPQ